MEKEKKENKTKPKYGMAQNTAFMISTAWRECKSVLWLALLFVGLGVASNLLELFVVPTILSKIESHTALSELLITILLFTLGLMAVGAATAYVNRNILFGRVFVRSSLISDIHDKFAKTSYPNTEDQKFIKLCDRARITVNSNSEATEAIWTTLTDILKNCIGFVIYLFLLTNLSPFIIAITLATTVIGYLAALRINEWKYRHREEEAAISRKMEYIDSKTRDYSLAKDIRIFGMKPWLQDLYNESLHMMHDFFNRGERVYFWADFIDVVLSFLRNGIAYAYLIAMALKNGLSASQFLLYFTAISGFTAWVTGILSGFTTLNKQSLDISTVREFIESDESFKFEDGEAITPDKQQEYSIELENVSFRYPKADHDTLHNINLKIKAGEKLAVVGLNGAGKTTLIKLICGFYDPTEGKVLLNGRDIRQFKRRDYYKHFSAVFQEFSLLAASIAANIAQTDRAIDMEKVKACAQKAGIKQKIESLPEGYETHIGKNVYEDAVELSGGEMQRLMLARALYKEGPIIILDEPTAALDPIAESDIYNRYNELTKGCTSVYISHRLASTRFCDRIILIENGDIAEEGTHDELMKRGGRYAGLFEIQSRYYRKSAAHQSENAVDEIAVSGGEYNEQQ